MLSFSHIQSGQRRLLEPCQILAAKLTLVSHVAAGQENGQRQASQNATDALADLLIGSHRAGPGLQELDGFFRRQRR